MMRFVVFWLIWSCGGGILYANAEQAVLKIACGAGPGDPRNAELGFVVGLARSHLFVSGVEAPSETFKSTRESQGRYSVVMTTKSGSLRMEFHRDYSKVLLTSKYDNVKENRQSELKCQKWTYGGVFYELKFNEDDPLEIVRYFHGLPFGGAFRSPLASPPARSALLSTEFRATIDGSEVRTGSIDWDFDPFPATASTDGSSVQFGDLEYRRMTTGPQFAQVKAIYTAGKKKTFAIFVFVREKKKWKIDDVIGKDSGSVRNNLR